MISQLPELRNRYGTGHGRPVPSIEAPELAHLCVDTTFVWIRWAVGRLGHLLTSQPAGLARELNGPGIFRRGQLAARLRAMDLPGLDEADQHLLGVAVARRAMGITSKTFTVAEDGVEGCANDRGLDTWPAAYRSGLVEGLFLDRAGFVDVDMWAIRNAARVVAPHPAAADVLRGLAGLISQATWSARFAADQSGRDQIAREMPGLAGALPDAETQAAWVAIAGQPQRAARLLRAQPPRSTHGVARSSRLTIRALSGGGWLRRAVSASHASRQGRPHPVVRTGTNRATTCPAARCWRSW